MRKNKSPAMPAVLNFHNLEMQSSALLKTSHGIRLCRMAPLLRVVCADKRLILCIVRRTDCFWTNHHYSNLPEQAWRKLDKSTWGICTQRQLNWKWSYIHELTILQCSFNYLKQFLGLICSNDIPFAKVLLSCMFQGTQVACFWSSTKTMLLSCGYRYFTWKY